MRALRMARSPVALYCRNRSRSVAPIVVVAVVLTDYLASRWACAPPLPSVGWRYTSSVGLMDLGISGRRAAVAASSAGLGLACARALAAEGVRVALCGRQPDRVDAAVASLH